MTPDVSIVIEGGDTRGHPARCLDASRSASSWRAAGSSGMALLLGLVVLASAFRYAHDVAKFLVTSDFIDFAHYYTHARIVADGANPLDPAAVAAMDAQLGLRRSPGHALYLPLFYLVMQPWVVIPFKASAALWLLASQVALLAAVTLVWRRSPDTPLAAVAAALFVVLNFQPLFEDFAVGQSNVWLLLLVTAGWWTARRGRPWTAAVPLALTIHVKPQYGLLVPLLFLKGDRGLAVRVVVAAAAGLGVSLLTLGATHHVDWVRLLPTGFRYAFVWNVAPRAIFERVVTSFGGGVALAEALVLALDVAILAAVVAALRRRVGERGQDLQWGLAATAIPLVSPATEEHHLVLLLFPLLLLILAPAPGAVQVPRRGVAADAALLVVSVLLLGSSYSFVRFPAVQSGLAALLLGGKIVGAGLLALALVRRIRASSDGGGNMTGADRP